MIDFITKRNVNICRGNIDNLFDKALKFTTNGSGYINSSKIPQNSVSFWIADKDLIKSIDSKGKVRYKYQTDDPWSSEIQIKYVGLQPTEDIIPKGTLLRVSLALMGGHQLMLKLKTGVIYNYQVGTNNNINWRKTEKHFSFRQHLFCCCSYK